MKQLSPLDAAWLALESRDTPMHVGGLFEFTLPPNAPEDLLRTEVERMRSHATVPQPWNLRLVDPPVVGARLPLMREDRDVDLDYHVRHSALPAPGGQRELGILISRLHSIQLDMHRPLWEMHLIEGLEQNRFALYFKMHHSLIDGVSGIRMALRALSGDPDERGMEPFWMTGAGAGGNRAGGGGAPSLGGVVRSGTDIATGLGRAGLEQLRATLNDDDPLRPAYTSPRSVLASRLNGQRRFATQQYDLAMLKEIAKAADATLNDVVLFLSATALRSYLQEHASLPKHSLTTGIPVNLRDASDESAGNAIGMIVAELGTNIADPRKRLERIKGSVREAKRHMSELPPGAQTPYTLLLNTPYIAGLLGGLRQRSPIPFSLAISNVPGPTEPLYYNGARLDAIFPLSLLTHGNALNITCLSYAGTLNFGFTGARDALPHLQKLAIYMGETVEQLPKLIGPKKRRAAAKPKGPAAKKPAAKKAKAKRTTAKTSTNGSGAERAGKR